MSEPKNSLIKQYEKLFQMDGVQLSFDTDALEAVAGEAIQRNTGARGLRSIMEGMMLNLMYEIPSRTDVREVIVHADCVSGKTAPEYVLKELVELESPALSAPKETK